MRFFIATILATLTLLTTAAAAKPVSEKHHKTFIFLNHEGIPTYEGQYRLSTWKGKPAYLLVKSYRYGPFLYRCMAPETIAHPGGIRIRNYLSRPSLCYVPLGYKVCLQPALVQHGPVNVLPYLYVNAQSYPCKTESGRPQKTPIFYRPAPMLPIKHPTKSS